MSSKLYIVDVLYMLAKQYLIDIANVSNGSKMLSSSSTSDVQYLTELNELTASDRLYITQ
jgi:hypothetical protein